MIELKSRGIFKKIDIFFKEVKMKYQVRKIKEAIIHQWYIQAKAYEKQHRF